MNNQRSEAAYEYRILRDVGVIMRDGFSTFSEYFSPKSGREISSNFSAHAIRRERERNRKILCTARLHLFDSGLSGTL